MPLTGNAEGEEIVRALGKPLDYAESKMHSIVKGRVEREQCNQFVAPFILGLVNRLITIYTALDKGEKSISSAAREVKKFVGCNIKTKAELFEAIIMNLPIGYELTFGEVINYLQLKSMYHQRKGHKMSGWRVAFKEWVESLPHSHLITGGTDDR